jgi:hypothetical protein
LAWFDRPGLEPSNPLVVFGRVRLFYFVIHFYAAYAAAVVLALQGGPRELFPGQFGYDLWVTYAVWAAIVLVLYPVCRRFAEIKARRQDWWLSYL